MKNIIGIILSIACGCGIMVVGAYCPEIIKECVLLCALCAIGAVCFILGLIESYTSYDNKFTRWLLKNYDESDD